MTARSLLSCTNQGGEFARTYRACCFAVRQCKECTTLDQLVYKMDSDMLAEVQPSPASGGHQSIFSTETGQNLKSVKARHVPPNTQGHAPTTWALDCPQSYSEDAAACLIATGSKPPL